jgi:hypothetical protein
MIVDDNNFFNFSAKNGNIFSTNVKSILGRNIILNFIQGMDFEIKMFNFSEQANEIASFYEKIKAKGDISKFFKNDVIKMILEEIQDMPTLRDYLYKRIFNLIEQDKIDMLQKIYDDNENITSKVEAEENKYINEQRQYKEAIKKIMVERGISEENAKILYENKKLKEQLKKHIQKSSGMTIPVPISDDIIDSLTYINFDMTGHEHISGGSKEFTDRFIDIDEDDIIPREQKEIILSDEDNCSYDDFDDGNFWD